MRFTTKLLPSRSKNLGILTLNHPKALHALTRDMIDAFHDVLTEWRKDATLRAILLQSSPPRREDTATTTTTTKSKRPAFCAGGDVKTLYHQGMTSGSGDGGGGGGGTEEDRRRPAEFFFYSEYQVNHAIATYDIPIVSLWDGIVFGGGVGISVHGKYRIATEQTLFAMPETAIGLYPDVGGMWFLPRLLSMSMAKYLALTGKQLGPADLLHTGIATHYVRSAKLPELQLALADATELENGNTDGNDGDKEIIDSAVARVLMSFHETIPTHDCHLVTNKAIIDQTFGGDNSVEDIMAALKSMSTAKEGGDDAMDFAKVSLQTLLKVSPTSLKLTLEGLKRGAACQTIGEDLQMEYRMSKACLRPGSDFFEGVRANLIDKDRAPKWKPPTVEQVTTDMIEAYFAPIEDEWIIPPAPSQPSRL